MSYKWWFEGGSPLTLTDKNPQNILYQNPGSFDVKLRIYNATGDSSELIKENYITVNPVCLIINGTLVVSSGTFYDSGAESSNYLNAEDYVLTLKPPYPTAKIEVVFASFDIQTSTSCTSDNLSIYDGSTITSALIGKYCGTTSPGTILATNAEGSLTFKFHSNNSTTRPGWKANIRCRGSQAISLNAGWNGLSSFIQPENASLEAVFSHILSDIVIVQNENGFFLPGQNINTLGNWNPEKGYQIKMQNSVELGIIGTSNTGITLDLTEGWNLLPVPCSQQVAVTEVISEISQKVIIIKESTGDQVYWPAAGITTLQNLQSGKSYLIKVSEPVSITFPN